MYYVDEILKRNYARLEILWSEKLIADGIVKQTEHGNVSVDFRSQQDNLIADATQTLLTEQSKGF